MNDNHQEQDNQENIDSAQDGAAREKRELPEAAKRALAEAEERRKITDAQRKEEAKEYGGRGGADPSRFGDWEIDGRAIDF
jgi:hypothetical protein